MKGFLFSALALLGTAGAAGYQEYSYVRVDVNGWLIADAWCDTPGRVLAVTNVTGKSAVRPTILTQWVGGKLNIQSWQYGPGEGAAGSTYAALTPAGQQVSDSPRYFVHTSNIENVMDPAYRLTHVVEFKVPAGTFRCRYVPQAAVLAATAKHSVVVWENAGKVTYSSQNRNGTPGVQLTGGTHTQSAGRELYQWQKNGYTYALAVGREQTLGGTLTVTRGGRTLSQETLLAYSLSVPK